MTAQNSNEKPATRYLVITRYEIEAGSDPEASGTGSIKNFPRTFIPMKELEEPLSGE